MLSEGDRIFSAEWNTGFYKYLKKRMLVNKPYLGSLYRVNANSKKATCNTVGMEELFHSDK